MTHAFDALAATYDDTFSNTSTGRYLRNRVQQRLISHFTSGDFILEMGCGTGEDARFLAEQGIKILATDASPEMRAITQSKTAEFSHVTVASLDISALPHEFPVNDYQQLDGVFASFGVLNCIPEWQTLAQWLASRLEAGATACFGVMSPFCVWETVWHGAHLDFKVATRRWRKNVFQPRDDAPPLAVYYPTIRRLTREFEPYFQRMTVHPLGLFLPPSDVFPVIEKRSGLRNLLTRLEQTIENRSMLSLFADHYWIEFQRTTVPVAVTE